MSTGLQKSGNTGLSTSDAFIVHKKENLCPMLSNTEKEIVLASNGKKIKDCDRKEVELKVLECITKALISIGHKKALEDNDDMDIVIQGTTGDLYLNFSNITLKDFEIAVYKGSRGQYNRDNEITLVNIASIFNWISRYLIEKTPIVKRQRDHENKKEGEKTAPLSPEHQRLYMIRVSLEAYDEYKTKGFYNDFGAIVYDFLEEEKIIHITPEENDKFWNEAKEKIKKSNSIEFANSKADRERRVNTIKGVIDETPDAKVEIRLKAKELSINNFFKGLKDNEKLISDLLPEIQYLTIIETEHEVLVENAGEAKIAGWFQGNNKVMKHTHQGETKYILQLMKLRSTEEKQT